MLANIGPAEAIIIFIAILSVLFGSKKTSEIARDVGAAGKEFKKVGKEYREAIEDLKKPVNDVLNAPAEEETAAETKPMADLSAEASAKAEAPTVDMAKQEVAQLAQLAQKAKEGSKPEGGEKSAS